MSPEDRDLLTRISVGFEKACKPSTGILFGLTPRDLIIGLGVLLSLYGFYVRSNDFMAKQMEINKHFFDYSQSSDAYHSAATGRQFYQGKPIDISSYGIKTETSITKTTN